VSAPDTPAIRRFLAELAADGVSPGTIIGTRAVLRLVLSTAVEGGALTTNPCGGIKVPRQTRPEMHFLTPEEVERLANAIAHPPAKPGGHGTVVHWRTELPEFGLLVRLCAYTGLRAGEVVALRIGRLNLLRSSLEVAESATEVNGRLVLGPTKNYQRRTVPLPRFLRDDLAAHLRQRRGRADDLVFASPEGSPLRHNNFYGRHFKPAVRRAGIPESVRFHDLRHSYGFSGGPGGDRTRDQGIMSPPL
jgi:integrase